MEDTTHTRRGIMRVDAEFTASAGKMARMRSAALSALLLMAPAIAGAQQVAAADLPAPQAAMAEGKACFQPRALPVCRSFWITEFGVQVFLSQPPGIHDQRRVMGTWELGWMKNRSTGDA